MDPRTSLSSCYRATRDNRKQPLPLLKQRATHRGVPAKQEPDYQSLIFGDVISSDSSSSPLGGKGRV